MTDGEQAVTEYEEKIKEEGRLNPNQTQLPIFRPTDIARIIDSSATTVRRWLNTQEWGWYDYSFCKVLNGRRYWFLNRTGMIEFLNRFPSYLKEKKSV